MPKPAVSVVLVTYNRSRALADTIDTLLSQTFSDFEMIVCDDCSPDDTEEVVRGYQQHDSRIFYRRNERNLRMPENMNAGIRQARGEYIANLHDGDLYHPHLLEKWKSALDRNPGAAFVFNQYVTLTPDGDARIDKEDLPEVFSGSRLLEEVYFRRWRFGSPVWGTVMARRSAYEDVGLFDARFGFLADVDMWLRLAENYDVAYVAEPLIRIISHDKLPQQFMLDDEASLLHRMFWESRMRHYQDRKIRRAVEAARHIAYITKLRIYLFLIRTKGAVMRYLA